MTKPIRWSWAQALLLSIPPLLLVALGVWLYSTRPTELILAEARFKLLPKPLAHPASALKKPSRPAAAMQIVLFLKHLPGEKPVWWGNPVTPGLSDPPCFMSSQGQRRFMYTCVLNKATFDAQRRQYKTVLECIIPDTPAFTHQSTFTASIDLWQNGRVVGSGTISIPVAPA